MPTHLESPEQDIPFFLEATGADPYPWQIRLYKALSEGNPPAALDIPTGLGKTSAVLLYLLALAAGAPLARRLAYVVDRRAIVDQTAAVIRDWAERIAAIDPLARRLRALAAFHSSAPLAVGVLRGGLADDGAWRLDPAKPAVVVGTVDMIGSRLLFSGYGDGQSRRALHAGLLGQDTFLLLDEAHLSPGMAGLVRGIERLGIDGERPGLRALTLSATPDRPAVAFGLDAADLAHAELYRRYTAHKALHLETADDNAQCIERLVQLAAAFETGSILIFVRTVRDAGKIAAKLAKQLGRDGADRLGLLTGTLRGAERERLADSALWAAFDPARKRDGPATPARFLVSTAAGEVGIDLDADHAVMDLAPLESAIQRLGRVNRAGRGTARVHIVANGKDIEPRTPKVKPTHGDRVALALRRTYATLQTLPNASPEALRRLSPQALQDATAPRATPVPLNAATVECFAATSARIATPDLDLFLRGLSDERDIPDCHLVWRWDTPHLVAAGAAAAADALGLFRPQPREIARAPIYEATELLKAAMERCNPLPVLIRDARGQVAALRLEPDAALPALAYATVILPCEAGGLRDGLPDPACPNAVEDIADSEDRMRRIVAEGTAADLPAWIAKATTWRIPLHDSDDEEAEPRWLLYALRRFDPALAAADSDLTRLAASPQTVAEHNVRVAAAARRIGCALRLPDDLIDALETAGRWHDSGKERRLWQRAAGVPAGGPPLAKSREGRFSPNALGGYRHEFGSLADAETALAPGRRRDLILHLIAAHHGRARPGFADPRHWDPELSADRAEELAHRVAERFGRLQGALGPWRLAWLEALVKSADAWVSANRDTQGDGHDPVDD